MVDPIRGFFVTVSEQSSGGKASADPPREEFFEAPYSFSGIAYRTAQPRQR
jgi:hypothetical protein